MSIFLYLCDWGCIKIFWAKRGHSERKPWHKQQTKSTTGALPESSALEQRTRVVVRKPHLVVQSMMSL